MKHHVLSRYESAEGGGLIIDVTAPRVEDLYNNFDRTAPYIRRDLDQDLVNYLIDCAREVGRQHFMFRLTLGQPLHDDQRLRVRKSINTFFLYLAATERHGVKKMFHRSAILAGIGFAILSVSVWINRYAPLEFSVMGKVLAEGLTIAAWVSLWQAFTSFLIEWFPCRKDIRLYRRMAHAQVLFREHESIAGTAAPR